MEDGTPAAKQRAKKARAQTKAPKPKMKPKKPVNYTPELGTKICELVAECNSLTTICARKGMPSRRTIIRWQHQHEEFAQRMEKAREERADARAERIDDLAKQVTLGKLAPDAGRVAIAALQWLCGKENARRYGDRVVSEVAVRVGVHTEQASDSARWIEGILAGTDRSNAIPLLSHQPAQEEEPAA